MRGTFEAPERERIEANPKEFYLKHTDQIKDHYDIHEVVGEGALSRVKRGVHKLSQVTRAIKVVRKEDLEWGDRGKLLDEIELLKELDHPNIGQVIEMFEDRKKMYFVNEMFSGGTLYEAVGRDLAFSELKAAKVTRQLLSAVSYLHSQNIVHGDIKPQNIHFRSPKEEMIKLIDFATSRRINAEHAMHGVFGTSYYLAPEVIEGTYSEKCDVWSVGVILYILLTGEPPFNGATDVEVVENIKAGEFSLDGEHMNHVSAEVKDLLAQLLTREDHRLSAQEAFHHPWFELCKQIEEDGEEPDHAKEQHIHRALSNLRNFSTKHKVKQSALGYLVQHFMSMSEKAELEQVFNALDTSGDGYLSKDELLDGYRKYYGDDFNEAEVEALIAMADASEDGLIGYSEFMLTCVNTEKFQTHNKLEAIFNELDIDKNNRISLDELN